MPEQDSSSGQKIGILTFHRCVNYGSYWQARCLVEGLRARGHDAVLLDHVSRQVNWREWRCAFQPLLPQRSQRSDFAAYKAKAKKVLAAADALPSSPRFHLHHPEALPEYDLVLVGSDEVWNMRHPWYGGKAIFYGQGIKAKRIASYAASFGNHDASEGLDPWWADRLRRFDAISVRDDNARTMIRDATGIEAEMVLDPCLQFPPLAAAADEREPYVAVYGHNFPGWYAEAVRHWAERNDLRLVSIGYRNDWADIQRIDAGPEDFAALMAGAVAVATNFFHGAVFALLNGRPFAAVSSAYRSNKLRDLMASVGAEAHLTTPEDGEERFDALLGHPLSSAIPAHIDALRARSSRYLNHVLG